MEFWILYGIFTCIAIVILDARSRVYIEQMLDEDEELTLDSLVVSRWIIDRRNIRLLELMYFIVMVVLNTVNIVVLFVMAIIYFLYKYVDAKNTMTELKRAGIDVK